MELNFTGTPSVTVMTLLSLVQVAYLFLFVRDFELTASKAFLVHAIIES
jgi:hypothetical protein